MYYKENLEKQLKEEKNIVNRMYLNEILLQLNKFEKALKAEIDSKNYYKQLAEVMSTFTQQFEDPKYQYNHSTKNGFPRNSLILAPIYLDDLINSYMDNQPILKNKGVKWGYQHFNMNLYFNPQNLNQIEENLNYDSRPSPKFLLLSQKIDLQFRTYGKRVFQKTEVILPLITFFTYKHFDEEKLIRVAHYSAKAKESLKKSHSIVVCESIDRNIISDVKNSQIDNTFVLRKQVDEKHLADAISEDVLKAIKEKIDDALYKEDNKIECIEKTGFIY